MQINELNQDQQTRLEAAVLRRLLDHLSNNSQVQNIDLMNLAGFCRNCLSKWYVAAAGEEGLDIGYEDARTRVYGIPYEQWKTLHQKPASAEQLAAFSKKE